MKKRRKILPVLFWVFVIGVIGVLITVGLFADGALRVAVESAGTKALNVGVSVSDVDLSILGAASVSGISRSTIHPATNTNNSSDSKKPKSRWTPEPCWMRSLT